jgi:hypothetical protein
MSEEERRYRLYIDESGDHTFKLVDDDNHRYLGLLGIWFDVETPYRAFAQALRALKAEIFGWHPDGSTLCLHRKDIVERRGIFSRLRNLDLNRRFEDGLRKIIQNAEFHMACVVIDKASHRARAHREMVHPYHHCVAALLECYARWLSASAVQGDVMAESRGRIEDQELSEAFETALERGTRFHSPQSLEQVLTSKKIKLKKKEHAIPGLELADLLAYPFKREMVAEKRGEEPPRDFSAALLDVARPKMNCEAATGMVAGYGKMWLD